MPSNIRGERIVLPDIPKEQWSDFRSDYEAGMTLADIAVKYYCDPRTVRTALSLNRGSNDFGKRIVPKKADAEVFEDIKVITGAEETSGFTIKQHASDIGIVSEYLSEGGFPFVTVAVSLEHNMCGCRLSNRLGVIVESRLTIISILSV